MPEPEAVDVRTLLHEHEHIFECLKHGTFTVLAPPEKSCPVLGSCPVCKAEPPWFNTDIDAGPYGLLGAPLLDCNCRRQQGGQS